MYMYTYAAELLPSQQIHVGCGNHIGAFLFSRLVRGCHQKEKGKMYMYVQCIFHVCHTCTFGHSGHESHICGSADTAPKTQCLRSQLIFDTLWAHVHLTLGRRERITYSSGQIKVAVPFS